MATFGRAGAACCAVIGLAACGGRKAVGTAPAGPAAPTGLVVIGADGQVNLAWNATAGATGYRVKRGSHGGPYALIASTEATRHVDGGRTNGTSYAYVVSAVDASGEGPDSTEAQATPTPGLPVLPEADPTRNAIGLNTWFLCDWDGSLAFVDAMKHARPWQDGADWSKPVAGIDPQGWPTADASTVILSGTPAQLNGTYKLVFNGQAEISCLFFNAATVTDQTYDSATNTTRADVTFSYAENAPMGLVFRNTRRSLGGPTNTGFTNARLFRPGYPSDGSAVFTTPFLAALRRGSVVRLMDWGATNDNLVQHWSQRMTPQGTAHPGPAYTGPGGRAWATSSLGVALEHQIQLANTLHADCWINIPVAADDAYVRNTALALRFGTDGTNPYTSRQVNPAFPPLDPTLRIYVEYANEIWNGAAGFASFGVIQDLVGALPEDHPVMVPAESNVYFRMWRYPAFRLARISDLFREVYGDASMMNRVRPVLMTQQGNGQATLSTALTWLNDYAHRQTPSREPLSYIYGAGGSAYYSVNAEPADKSDVNGFFAPGNYPATQTVKAVGVDAAWAANFGLKRIAYEGGPSLDNFNDAQSRALNADARMEDMVLKTHDAWSAQGGDLLMYYTVCGPSRWEFTPDIATTSTPKFKALDQLNARPRAVPSLGPVLPGTLVAADWGDYKIRTGYDYPTTVDGLACVAGNDAGEWIAYPSRVAEAFTGSLVVRGASAGGPTVLNVWINGVKKGQVTLAASSQLVASSALSGLAIPAGLVVIRLEVVSGGFSLRAITLS